MVYFMENPIYKSMILDVPTIPLRSKGYVTVIYHVFFPKIWLPEMAISRNDWGVAQIKGVQPQ